MARYKRNQRQRRREVEIPELNVTPFMNLMIVLVPVLLLSLVFTHTTVIELDFPSSEANVEQTDEADEQHHLEIILLAEEIRVADQHGTLKRLPMIDGVHDYAGLNDTLRAVKQQMPAKRDALLLLEPTTNYQSLVSTMDSIRGYRLQQNEELVFAELFPNVSLGDAPAVADPVADSVMVESGQEGAT